MPELQISLRRLTKYETYLVEANFAGGGASYDLTIQTPCADVAEAIEWARGWFQHFGVAVAASLERPGSLV